MSNFTWIAKGTKGARYDGVFPVKYEEALNNFLEGNYILISPTDEFLKGDFSYIVDGNYQFEIDYQNFDINLSTTVATYDGYLFEVKQNNIPIASGELEGFIIESTYKNIGYFTKEKTYYFDDKIELTITGEFDAESVANKQLKEQRLYYINGDNTFNGTNNNDILAAGNGNDVIYGNDGNDDLFGENGIDIIFGGKGDDDIKGGEGNDSLNGNEGNDFIDGGNGVDIANFNGNYSDYSFDRNNIGLLVIDNRNGFNLWTDTLKDIELLDFADKKQIDINTINVTNKQTDGAEITFKTIGTKGAYFSPSKYYIGNIIDDIQPHLNRIQDEINLTYYKPNQYQLDNSKSTIDYVNSLQNIPNLKIDIEIGEDLKLIAKSIKLGDQLSITLKDYQENLTGRLGNSISGTIDFNQIDVEYLPGISFDITNQPYSNSSNLSNILANLNSSVIGGIPFDQFTNESYSATIIGDFSINIYNSYFNKPVDLLGNVTSLTINYDPKSSAGITQFSYVGNNIFSSSDEKNTDYFTYITRNSDTLVGTNGDDTLHSGEGDDTIDGRGGSDKMYGGNGIDTAKFSNNFNYYSINKEYEIGINNEELYLGGVSGDPFDPSMNLLAPVTNLQYTNSGNTSLIGGLNNLIGVIPFPDSNFDTNKNNTVHILDPITGSKDSLIDFEYVQFADQTVETSKVHIVKSYSGKFNEYKFYNRGNSQYQIKTESGLEDITGIPKILFSDRADGISAIADIKGTFDQITGLNDNTGQMFRLYNAAFARFPDAEGLRYWINMYDSGANTKRQIANSFLVSNEFSERYGTNLTNFGYIFNLYRNILGRDPDAGGLNYWVGQIDSGAETRAEALVGFAESIENINLFSEMTGLY